MYANHPGTGLIIGSGTSLARSGPGSMLISYTIMGITCFGVMLALGEMSTKFPSKKGFAGHATRCVDPAFGFATALIYLCKVRAQSVLEGTELTRSTSSSVPTRSLLAVSSSSSGTRLSMERLSSPSLSLS